MTKSFGPFFVVLSSVASLRKQFIGFHKLMWKLLWNFYEHVFSTYEVVENTSFRKKAIVQAKKKCRPIFLVISSVSNLSGQFLRVQKVFWQLLWKL